MGARPAVTTGVPPVDGERPPSVASDRLGGHRGVTYTVARCTTRSCRPRVRSGPGRRTRRRAAYVLERPGGLRASSPRSCAELAISPRSVSRRTLRIPSNQFSVRCALIIPMIIQTIPLDPSRAVWTDSPSNVSRPGPSGAVQIDAEHQATDLVLRSPTFSLARRQARAPAPRRHKG